MSFYIILYYLSAGAGAGAETWSVTDLIKDDRCTG